MSVRHKPLAEQVIVVVGASTGIGRATVLAASAAGATVVAATRGHEALQTLESEAGPGRTVVKVADTADPQQMVDLAAVAVEQFGGIDTWAHVAGVVEYARFEVVPARVGVQRRETRRERLCGGVAGRARA